MSTFERQTVTLNKILINLFLGGHIGDFAAGVFKLRNFFKCANFLILKRIFSWCFDGCSCLFRYLIFFLNHLNGILILKFKLELVLFDYSFIWGIWWTNKIVMKEVCLWRCRYLKNIFNGEEIDWERQTIHRFQASILISVRSPNPNNNFSDFQYLF